MSRTARRHAAILELIGGGEADVDLLAGRFKVSASTIRRDLAVMSGQGMVTRTYGGALSAHPEPEHALSRRERQNRDAKHAIAQVASSLIRDNESVLLDAGSTVAALGRLLPPRRLRVVTSNLPLVPVLASAPGIELIVLAGSVRAISMGVVGPLTEMTLRRLSVDKVFMSADGVMAGRGLCEASPEQTALKEMMMAQAKEVYVLADSSKLGRASQQFWAVLPATWTLITEADAGEALLEPFRRMPGVRLLLA
ncbi:MAG: DeoR/GlpR family DNA-binding transcription regulator [Holophaga sp.]|nr:DeoR/GlpR family DNA-binding transcription regulator [Holophaga sp.]